MFDLIQQFSDWLTFSLLGLSSDTHFGVSINFFIFETIKIFLLLVIIIFIMGVINSYFPVERLRDFLRRNKLYGLEHLLASIFGAITPFCSCSSVPLFIGFVQGGIPLGVTFSFLITSPLVNEVALAIFIGMFGWKITLIYATSGILLGTIGGWVLGKLKLDYLLSEWAQKIMLNSQHKLAEEDNVDQSFIDRLPSINREVKEIIKGIAVYVVIGIAIGAGMHGYVPENFFQQYLNGGEWWTIPLAVILAIPMYANAAAIVPVIQVFVSKGVPLGTAIAFMMGTVGLSLPEATLLKKVMTIRLIAIFFGTVSLFIIFSGFLFNLLF